MSFNPDSTEQAVEVRFLIKSTKENLPSLMFNGNYVLTVDFQKHLGLTLDCKLDFNHHLKEKKSKANKSTYLSIKIFSVKKFFALYVQVLFAIFEYHDIIYDRPLNDTFTR